MQRWDWCEAWRTRNLFRRMKMVQFYFLECAARVGGAYINEMVEAATGINLWREWARIEIAGGDGSYRLPAVREEYAGVVLSLARQEDPDTSAYNDPEIFLRIKRHHHAGLVLRSSDPGRCTGAIGKLRRAICRGVSGGRAAAGETDSVRLRKAVLHHLICTRQWEC